MALLHSQTRRHMINKSKHIFLKTKIHDLPELAAMVGAVTVVAGEKWLPKTKPWSVTFIF